MNWRRVAERTAQLRQTVEVLQEEVAERIAARKTLEQRSETLQKIIDNIPVMLCFYDAEGCVSLINEELHKVPGYTLVDFRNHNVMELRYRNPVYRQGICDFMMAARPGWRDLLVRNKAGRKVASSWANVRLSDARHRGPGSRPRRAHAGHGVAAGQTNNLWRVPPSPATDPFERLVQYSIDAGRRNNGDHADANTCTPEARSTERVFMSIRVLIADDKQDAFSLLTPREREVLQLIAEGHSTKQAAHRLSISPKTVEAHRLKVMNKLDIDNVAQLTKYAIQEGLTSSQP
jgi:DNA-binding CsgD family transcriptional regulator